MTSISKNQRIEQKPKKTSINNTSNKTSKIFTIKYAKVRQLMENHQVLTK